MNIELNPDRYNLCWYDNIFIEYTECKDCPYKQDCDAYDDYKDYNKEVNHNDVSRFS